MGVSYGGPCEMHVPLFYNATGRRNQATDVLDTCMGGGDHVHVCATGIDAVVVL